MRLDELRRHTHLRPGAQQRAGDGDLHVQLRGQRAQVGRVALEPGGGERRAHHQRLQITERGRDRLGEAEREEVDLGVRPEHPEWQHDQPRDRPGGRRLSGIGQLQRRAQILRDRRRVGVAIGRPFGGRAVDDPVHGRQRRRAAHRRQRLVHDAVEDLRRRLSGKRRAADQQLEEDGADREEIRSGVERIGGELLGRHVVRRAHDRSGHRDVGMCLVGGLLCRARQPEVEQLDAVGGEKDVRRFEVAMDQPAGVNRGQRREDPQRDVNALGERHRPAGEPRRQRLALEQLHRDEQLAVGLADLVQLADVGVRDAGGGARLAPEALSRLGIASRLAHHLDGDAAVKALVGGGIHDAHAAFAELRHHAVVGDRVGHEDQAILHVRVSRPEPDGPWP